MIQDIYTLADDKLSILYFLDCLNIPLTNGQITRFFVERNIINYFDLQQYLLDLGGGDLVDNNETGNSEFFSLSSKGKETLEFFYTRIPTIIRNDIENYAEKNRNLLKGESQITADYKKIANKQYEVICKVREKEMVLMELKLNVPNSNQANEICKKWRKRAPEVFKAVFDHFI